MKQLPKGILLACALFLFLPSQICRAACEISAAAMAEALQRTIRFVAHEAGIDLPLKGIDGLSVDDQDVLGLVVRENINRRLRENAGAGRETLRQEFRTLFNLKSHSDEICRRIQCEHYQLRKYYKALFATILQEPLSRREQKDLLTLLVSRAGVRVARQFYRRAICAPCAMKEAFIPRDWVISLTELESGASTVLRYLADQILKKHAAPVHGEICETSYESTYLAVQGPDIPVMAEALQRLLVFLGSCVDGEGQPVLQQLVLRDAIAAGLRNNLNLSSEFQSMFADDQEQVVAVELDLSVMYRYLFCAFAGPDFLKNSMDEVIGLLTNESGIWLAQAFCRLAANPRARYGVEEVRSKWLESIGEGQEGLPALEADKLIAMLEKVSVGRSSRG